MLPPRLLLPDMMGAGSVGLSFLLRHDRLLSRQVWRDCLPAWIPQLELGEGLVFCDGARTRANDRWGSVVENSFNKWLDEEGNDLDGETIPDVPEPVPGFL